MRQQTKGLGFKLAVLGLVFGFLGCADPLVNPNETADTETETQTDTESEPEYNNILVLASDHELDGLTSFHTLLANEADMDNVDYWNTDLTFDGSPTLEDLLPYDGVIAWINSGNTDPVAVYDALLQYIDAGGKVVFTSYGFSKGFGSIPEPLASSPYSPFEPVGVGDAEDITLSTNYDDPTHEILQNVVTPPAVRYYELGVQLNPGATLIAHWDIDGYDDPAIAINAAKNFVGITGLVAHDNVTGDHALIVRNALVYMIEN